MFQQILDGLTDGVAALAEDRVVYANRVLERALGRSLPGEGAKALIAECSQRGLEVELRPMENGQLLIARDREETERRILRADRLTSLGTLAAGVTHEINNPLAFVVANLQFLAEKLADSEDESLREALLHARQGADRVQHVVQQLRGFATGDDSGRTLVDLKKLIDDAVEMVSNEIRHRARLRREDSPVAPVLGNPRQLLQVMVNLLVNAAHAIPEDGASHHEIRLSLRSEEGRAVIEVADTGCGIAPENLKRIFEPFFTTKPIGQGTGLGLSICHGIVSAHGGELTVESTPGSGSRFRVLLPLHKSAPPPRMATPPGERRGRVLVIDDEPRIGAAIRRTLAQHEVIVMTNAREAVSALDAGEKFDLVVCDLMMPEMSGMEFYEHLARDHAELARHTIFLTGGAFTPRAQSFLQQVQNARMDKPFDPKQLRALVATLLR